MAAPVTLTSDRAGLVMDRGAKVKLRGVQIGRVGDVSGRQNGVDLKLEIRPDRQNLAAVMAAPTGAVVVAGQLGVERLAPAR